MSNKDQSKTVVVSKDGATLHVVKVSIPARAQAAISEAIKKGSAAKKTS